MANAESRRPEVQLAALFSPPVLLCREMDTKELEITLLAFPLKYPLKY